MTEHPAFVSRKAHLLSIGQLVTQRWSTEPGRAGTPQIYHNGLGRFFVGRPVLDQQQRVTIEYAPDPERVLELAATTIRRSRFSSYRYDHDQTFPVTKSLAYAAFPDLRPKNQPPRNEYTQEQIIEQIALARYPDATGVKDIQPFIMTDEKANTWLVHLTTAREFEYVTTLVNDEDMQTFQPKQQNKRQP